MPVSKANLGRDSVNYKINCIVLFQTLVLIVNTYKSHVQTLRPVYPPLITVSNNFNDILVC